MNLRPLNSYNFKGLHAIHGGETASTGILKLRLHTERFPVRS